MTGVGPKPVYELYRYNHLDGSAKEWAYADLGGGRADIRWGKAGTLSGGQEKPLLEAEQRATKKCRDGYEYVGQRHIDSLGRPYGVRPMVPSPQPAPPVPVPVRPKRTPIDITALLGGDDEGFYF